MEDFIWMTTRKIRAGALDDFGRVRRTNPYPAGLARAYAYWSEDGQEIIASPSGAQKKSCDAWRNSEAAEKHRESMAPTCSRPRKRSSDVANLRIPGQQE
jgi:hypothetical protein